MTVSNDQNMVKIARKDFKETVLITLFSLFLFVVVTVGILNHVDNQVVTTLTEEIERISDDIVYKSISDEEPVSALSDVVNNAYLSQIRVLASTIDESEVLKLSKDDPTGACEFLNKLVLRTAVEELAVVDGEGTVYLSNDASKIGYNVIWNTPMTEEQFQTLKEAADTTPNSQAAILMVYADDGNGTGEQYICTISVIPSSVEYRNPLYCLSSMPFSTINASLAYLQDRTILAQLSAERTGTTNFVVANLGTGEVAFINSVSSDPESTEKINAYIKEHLTELSTDKQWQEISVEGNTVRCYSRVLGHELVIGYYNTADYRIANLKSYTAGIIISCLFLVLEVLLVLYIMHLDSIATALKVRQNFVIGALLVAIVIFVLAALFVDALKSVSVTSDMAKRSDRILDFTTVDFDEHATNISNELNRLTESSLTMSALTISEAGFDGESSGRVNNFCVTEEDGTYHPVIDSLGNETTTITGNKLMIEYAVALGADQLWVVNDYGYAIASANNEWAYSINSGEEAELFRRILRGVDTVGMTVFEDKDSKEPYLLYGVPITLYAYTDASGSTKYMSGETFKTLPKDSQLYPGACAIQGILICKRFGQSSETIAASYFREGLYRSMLDSLKAAYVSICYDEESYSRNELCSENLGYDISFLMIPDTMKTEYYNYFPTLSGNPTFTFAHNNLAERTCEQYIFDYSTLMQNRGRELVFYGMTSLVLLLVLVNAIYIVRNKVNSVDTGEKLEYNRSDFSLVGHKLSKYGAASVPSTVLMTVGMFLTIVLVVDLITSSSGNSRLMFAQITTDEWIREINVFNIGSSVMIFGAALIVMATVEDIVSYLVMPLGGGQESVSKVVISILKFAVLVGVLLYDAYLVGVPTTTLSTITTVAIGGISLGIKGMFEDMVDGITLLINNRLYTGQRVKLGGNYYTVDKVGLNHIKLINDKGEIRYLEARDANQITYIEEW